MIVVFVCVFVVGSTCFVLCVFCIWWVLSCLFSFVLMPVALLVWFACSYVCDSVVCLVLIVDLLDLWFCFVLIFIAGLLCFGICLLLCLLALVYCLLLSFVDCVSVYAWVVSCDCLLLGCY